MWRADYVNNPEDDFNLIMEIFCDEMEVGRIYNDKCGNPMITIYAHDASLFVPCDWLISLVSDFIKI